MFYEDKFKLNNTINITKKTHWASLLTASTFFYNSVSEQFNQLYYFLQLRLSSLTFTIVQSQNSYIPLKNITIRKSQMIVETYPCPVSELESSEKLCPMPLLLLLLVPPFYYIYSSFFLPLSFFWPLISNSFPNLFFLVRPFFLL